MSKAEYPFQSGGLEVRKQAQGDRLENVKSAVPLQLSIRALVSDDLWQDVLGTHDGNRKHLDTS